MDKKPNKKPPKVKKTLKKKPVKTPRKPKAYEKKQQPQASADKKEIEKGQENKIINKEDIERNADIQEQTPQTPKTPKTKEKEFFNKFIHARDYISENFDIKYNCVSTKFEYKEKEADEYKELNENDIYIKMAMDGVSFSMNNLMSLLKSDYTPVYNPFIEYFDSLQKWDGKTDHIKALASFVNVKEDTRARFDLHFKKWLIRVIKCSIVDSYFNKQAFILVHDKQNSGKSTFCRFLCPPVLKDYIAENLSLDKDSRILITTNLLINLDELATLSKVEINALKAMFSKDKINDRLPFDRKNSIIPRRASFIGSTNQTEFLNDESGSVRWLCFIIDSINWNYSKAIDINEVWAQAYELFKTGFPCDLNAAEIAENEVYNRQFNVITSEGEMIRKYLRPSTANEQYNKFMTATDIVLYLQEIAQGRVKLNTINVGKALKISGFERVGKYPTAIQLKENPSLTPCYGYYIRENPL